MCSLLWPGGFLFEGLSDDEDDFHQVMLVGQVRGLGLGNGCI